MTDHLHALPGEREAHHRDIQGGAARAAVFGVSDGLVSNVSLILGVAGADPGNGVVRLAGLASLVAGAISMAAGEYVSMRAQTELLERELDLERIELARNPHYETLELQRIYESRGLDAERAADLAKEMMRDPEVALETHAREELGIDPNELGSPVKAAISSFLAFAIGALLPLLPWFFSSGQAATLWSVAIGAMAAVGVGVALSRFTGNSAVRSAGRQLLIATIASSATFAIGRLVGVTV